MEQMSKLSGVKIFADTDLAEEPIILKLDGVPLKAAMDKIAEVARAEWKPTSGKYRLQRTAEIIRGLEAEDHLRRLAAVKHSLERAEKLEAEEGPMTPEKAAQTASDIMLVQKKREAGESTKGLQNVMRRTSQRVAETWLLNHLLKNIGAERIAGLPRWGRFVFAPEPNAAQMELPGVTDELLERYVADQNTLSDTVISQAKKVYGDRLPYGLTESYPHIKALPLQIRVVIGPVPGSAITSVTLSVVDSTGNQVGSSSRALGDVDDPAEFHSQILAANATPAKEGIEVSPLVKELVSRVRQRNGGPASTAELTQSAREFVLTPTEHDPLSLATSEVVLKMAEQAGKNVAFLPTDLAENPALDACSSGRIVPKAWELGLQWENDMVTGDEGGWEIGRPLSVLDAARNRCPRSSLQTYIRRIAEKGYAAIEDSAEMALALPLGVDPPIIGTYKFMLLGSAAPADYYSPEAVLRLFGSLTDDQREKAAKGGLKLAFLQLSPEQRDTVARAVYTSWQPLEATPERAAKMSADENDRFNRLTRERTDAFPKGIPPATVLQIADESSNAFFYRAEIAGQPSQEMSAGLDEIANYIAMLRQPGLNSGSVHFRLLSVRAGGRRLVRINFLLDGAIMTEQLYENHPPKSGPLPPDKFLESLPGDVRKQMEARIADILDFYKTQHPGGEAPRTQPPLR